MRLRTIDETLQSVYEMGDASAKVYPYAKPTKKIDRDNPKPVGVWFHSDSDIAYEVNLFPTDEYLTVEFYADLKGDVVTNRGEVFKVMATVTSIIKDVIDVNPHFKGIIYTPSSKEKDGVDDGGSQRDKLYRSFISKHFPEATFIKTGKTVTVDFNQ